MNKLKSKNTGLFIKYQILLACNILIFTLLFNYVGSIYKEIVYKTSIFPLQNLTEKSAVKLQDSIKTALKNSQFQYVLPRYGVFFYVDNYTAKIPFITVDPNSSIKKIQDIPSDEFYSLMTKTHKKDVCFVLNTVNISKTSDIYKSLYQNKEINKKNNYISCPLYLEDSLVGYIGGVNTQANTSLFVDVLPIKNAATLTEDLLLTDL